MARKTHAPYMFLSVASLPLQYFSTSSHKRHDFIKKVHQVRALIFSINFVRNNSHSKKRYLS